MTLLSLLSIFGPRRAMAGLDGARERLDDVLDRATILAPALAPAIVELRAELARDLDPARLGMFVAALGPEAIEILRGHLHPRANPSDAA